MSTTALVASLREIGFDAYPEPKISGFAIKQFVVSAGPHTGDKIDLAITIDFPLMPPVGIHMRAAYGKLGVNDGINNVMVSAMGDGWRYFSRRYEAWSTNRTARAIITYINRILLDA